MEGCVCQRWQLLQGSKALESGFPFPGCLEPGLQHPYVPTGCELGPSLRLPPATPGRSHGPHAGLSPPPCFSLSPAAPSRAEGPEGASGPPLPRPGAAPARAAEPGGPGPPAVRLCRPHDELLPAGVCGRGQGGQGLPSPPTEGRLPAPLTTGLWHGVGAPRRSWCRQLVGDGGRLLSGGNTRWGMRGPGGPDGLTALP